MRKACNHILAWLAVNQMVGSYLSLDLQLDCLPLQKRTYEVGFWRTCAPLLRETSSMMLGKFDYAHLIPLEASSGNMNDMIQNPKVVLRCRS